MPASRLFTVTTALTVGAVLAWGVKALVIGLAGGLELSPLESPLFMLGLLLYTLGVLAIGLAVTIGRSVAMRILSVITAFVVCAGAFLAVDVAVAAMAPGTDQHWVWAEVQLWIVSALIHRR